MTKETQTASKWLTLVAILAIIWNLLGIVFFYRGINPSPDALEALSYTPEQIAYTMATPSWAVIANILAILTGLLGSIALLLRHKSAYYLFALSLVAIMIVMADAFMRNGFSIVGGASNGLSLAVIVIGIYLFWTAHLARASSALK